MHLLALALLLSSCHLGLQTQGENTTEWIGATLSCPHGGAVTFTIERYGRRVTRVSGNPVRVPVRRSLVMADWMNWCGPRTGLTVVARYGTLVKRVRARPVPLCLQKTQASTLTAIR